MRSPDEIRALLASMLAHVREGEGEARYFWDRVTATRFGDNAITQNTSSVSETAVVEVRLGTQRGTAVTNRLDPASLEQAVRTATTIATLSQEDPETVPLPGPQPWFDGPPAFFDATHALTPEQIAADVGRVVDEAKARRFAASGLFESTSALEGIANTSGLAGFDQSTIVDWSTTVHGPNGSGKAAQSQHDHRRIDVDALARAAVDGAAAAQDPVEVPPGDYPVIFEPAAVAALLSFFAYTMSAREADEGSSAFAGTVGTKLLSEAVTLRLAVDDPELPAPKWGSAGLAIEPRTWIERGVVQRLKHDQYWAARTGQRPDPAFYPLTMDGTERSVADLVRDCPRGLLVKNLWYIRFVDPRTLLLTGMTRDGVFLVEGGEVVRPVKNLRWNESPLHFLQQVTGLSRPERVGGRHLSKVPAVASEAFTFTSTTDSV